MPSRPLRLAPSAADLAPGFERIREEAGVVEGFPAEALAEAAAAAPGRPARDRRDLELLSIDPPGSRDLDQALAIAARGDGHRVWYAIADVAPLVPAGRAVDAAARARGVTVYLPDRRAPLHPPAIGEDSGSLLPGRDRAAVLWEIDLGAEGEPEAVRVERALVRSRRALSYAQAQAAIDGGGADDTLRLLRDVGRLRRDREAERGGVSLSIPAQEVVREGDGYALRYDATLPVEDWNAQISLLAGICAGQIMARGGVGLLRTLAPAEPDDVRSLRRSALALGVPWPRGVGYPEVARSLDHADPAHAAFAIRATRLFRGAGYAAWRAADGPPPAHAAIAAVYAHVTAPLRRLVDRFANALVLALTAGAEPPAWALAALDDLPGLMAEATRRERRAESLAIDYVESALLASRVGEEFAATVIDRRDDRAVVQLADPAVVAPLDGEAPEPGTVLRVRLTEADPAARRVRFTPA